MTVALAWSRPEPAIVTRWRAQRRTAVLPPKQSEIALAALIGPPGRDGAAATDLVLPAAFAVGGHRAVSVDALGKVSHATDGPSSPPAVVGVSLNAAIPGGSVAVRTAGFVEESGWAWAEGPVWLGPNGTLTQALPGTGALVQVGDAIGPTRLRLAPRLIAQL